MPAVVLGSRQSNSHVDPSQSTGACSERGKERDFYLHACIIVLEPATWAGLTRGLDCVSRDIQPSPSCMQGLTRIDDERCYARQKERQNGRRASLMMMPCFFCTQGRSVGYTAWTIALLALLLTLRELLALLDWRTSPILGAA